ncbi:restriction endonuclease [Mammaliicoccus sciuri]|uniref:restriction endonuclease n=1 Tax=Mammaliicoccus sciuri TaxID=1296 RepID=UPI001F3389C3|nr:restriction endonuclease [Mammaliicoccus sciuri]MCE5086071.1 restriction endonuclease [Mammaliicoccus sciuri]
MEKLEQYTEQTNTLLIYFIIFLLILLIVFKILPFILKYIKIFKRKSRYKKANIRDIDTMSGSDFELYLSVLFSELGYKTVVTPKSYDFGADLIIKKGNHKIVVQAKRYGYKKNVSISAIQEVFTAQRYHNADESWVVTNSFFTKSAIKLAKPCKVKLKNRNELAKWILSIQSEIKPKQVKKDNVVNRTCPKCNSQLVIRESKNGNEFIGCNNFPVCRYTDSL